MAMIFVNHSNHFRDFISLNEAWIQRYFSIEDADRRLAQNPAIVVDEGGAILTAVEEGRVVGACALFHHGERSFELARMAVDRTSRDRPRTCNRQDVSGRERKRNG